MAGKKAIGNADLIRDYDSEGQTHQTGRQSQPLRKPLMPFAEEVEGGGDAHRDQHHSADRASSKKQQVRNRPMGIPDGCENEQGDRSGAGEAMNDANNQRTQLLIETDPPK